MTETPPFRFEYDAASQVLAVRLAGAVTDEAFKACYAAVARCAETRPVRAALADLSGVQRFDVSASLVRHLSHLAPVLPDPTPRYVIAPQPHIYGLARMFQITSRAGRDGLHVVRTADDAYAALGLRSPQFEPLVDL